MDILTLYYLNILLLLLLLIHNDCIYVTNMRFILISVLYWSCTIKIYTNINRMDEKCRIIIIQIHLLFEY